MSKELRKVVSDQNSKIHLTKIGPVKTGVNIRANVILSWICWEKPKESSFRNLNEKETLS